MSYTYEYPRAAVTADCLLMTKDEEPQVLLVRRGNEPFKGMWAIPGGFMEMDETTEQCAVRELEEETGVKISVEDIYEIGAYSKVDRDPRHRTVSVAYISFVDKMLEAKGCDDAAEAQWWPIDSLPDLAFDHEDIINDAIEIYDLAIDE